MRYNGLAIALLTMMSTQVGCLQWVVPAHESGDAPKTVQSPIIPLNVFETLNGFDDMHKELCDNDGSHPMFPNDADRITKMFCQDLVPGGSMPEPHSLNELLTLLGLDFKDP